MSYLSDFIANVSSVIAGAAISQRDLVQLAPNGAYPVTVADFAAVPNMAYGTTQTSTATGQIVAQTSVVAGAIGGLNSRLAVAQGSDGSIFCVGTNDTSGNGCKVFHYSPAGTLLGSLALDTAAASLDVVRIFPLSNGNICCLWSISAQAIKFEIFDLNLQVIVAATAIETTGYSNGQTAYDAIPLSGGGFAVCYQRDASPTLQRFVTYDNTGVVVTAAATIATWSGTVGRVFVKMVQLSNGNIAFAFNSLYTTTVGLYHMVLTTAGVSVLALTNLDTVSGGSFWPDIAAMTGFYCVSRPNGTALKAFVFNNAGAQQGGTFSNSTTQNQINKNKLLSDGTQFWLLFSDTVTSKMELAKLPTTGTGYSTTNITLTVAQNTFSIDAFYENGYIVAVSSAGTGTALPQMWVVDTTTAALVNVAGTGFGTAPASTNGNKQSVIPGGDFSFICFYDYASTAALNLAVGKYASTAIVGISNATAAAGASVPLSTAVGAYTTNTVKGTLPKQFDMQAANIYGNKGSMNKNSTTLKGIV